MIKVCSIDPSTRKTGLAEFRNGKLVDYGLVDVAKVKYTEERIMEMCVNVLDYLNDKKPHIVYVEETWSNGNTSTIKKLMLIVGCIYGWCASNDREFVSVLPSEWRKWCGIAQGKKERKELKAASMEYVKKQFGVEVSEDEADAIALGYGTIRHYAELDEE